MKAGVTAAVALAAMASGVSAARHRHMHEALFKRVPDSTGQDCTTSCSTSFVVHTGEATLVPRIVPVQEAAVPPAPAPTPTPTPDAAAEAAAAAAASAAAQQKQQEEQKQKAEQEQKQQQQQQQSQPPPPPQAQSDFPAKEAEQDGDNDSDSTLGISLNVDVSAGVGAGATIKDGGLESSNDHFGVTYTPWKAKGQCKSEQEIDGDIAGMKSAGYTTVRIYQVVNGNCKIAEWVGKACIKHGLKLIVGIWIDAGKCNANDPDVKGQLDALAGMKTPWGVNNFDVVSLVVVGNEAVWGKTCSASQLASVLQGAKSTLQHGGYNGKYTVAETLDVWQQQEFTGALCPHVDFAGANIHAYFNPNTAPGQAGDFVKNQLSLVDKACPGKKGTNLECGWPTAGDTKGLAVPGVSQQAEAIKSIRKAIGSRTVFFSPFDDAWKDDTTSCNCEKHWGMTAETGIHVQVSL